MLWLPAGVLVAASAAAVGPAPCQPQAEYVYASDAGALLFYVRPSHLQTFEAIVERLRGALAGSGEEVRRQQAVGWKMFRSRERTADAVVFVFLFDQFTIEYSFLYLISGIKFCGGLI